MEVFNAEPNVRPQREAAYAERYVTVQPVAPLLALRLEQGGELHHDDGTVVRCQPGDWVVELPDGFLGRIASDVFASSFDIGGDVEAFAATRRQLGIDPPLETETVAEVTREEQAFTVKEQVLAAHAETNARVRLWAKSALDAGLIDTEEHDGMVANNELPDGLTVTEVDGEWTLTREGGHSIGSLEVKANDPDQVDLRDLTRTQLQDLCQERGLPFTAADRKAELLARLEGTEEPAEDGSEDTE